jgi:hypothetical protein
MGNISREGHSVLNKIGINRTPRYEVVKKLKICQNLFPPVSRPCGELQVTMENIGQNGLIHNLYLRVAVNTWMLSDRSRAYGFHKVSHLNGLTQKL